MNERKYNLDVPSNGDDVSDVFRCSGRDLEHAGEIGIAINGTPLFSLSRSYRDDLKIAFPSNQRAVDSGFYGDIVISEIMEKPVTLELLEMKCDKWVPYHSIRLSHTCSKKEVLVRNRDYCLDDILSWPGGKQTSQIDYSKHIGRENLLSSKGFETYSICGIPHFHQINNLPLIRINESCSTHPYSNRALEIINNTDGLILDIGAGIQEAEKLQSNMVLLDAVHFQNLDVVNTCPLLPFHSSCFDSIVSQAVFEHLDNPALMAREAFRVLQPGGLFYLTTAFMQPLHGDPSHYFNMTSHGLKRILDCFDVLDIGVEPFQYPSYGIQMGIEAVLPYLNGEIEAIFKKALDFVVARRVEIDSGLGEVGREILAAGVYAVARKPIAS